MTIKDRLRLGFHVTLPWLASEYDRMKEIYVMGVMDALETYQHNACDICMGTFECEKHEVCAMWKLAEKLKEDAK